MKKDQNNPPVETKKPVLEPVTVPPAGKTLEIGGPQGLEPTRYGDWERKGRVSDF